MAFKIEAAPTFRAQALVPQPDGTRARLGVEFVHKDADELASLLKSAATRDATGVLGEVIADWEADQPYSRVALADLLDQHPPAAQTILDAYLVGLSGGSASALASALAWHHINPAAGSEAPGCADPLPHQGADQMTTAEMKPVFRIRANPTFKARVRIPIPGAEPAVIECLFRHKTRAELRDLLDRAAENESSVVLGEILEGWSGVEREYTAEALAEMLDQHPSSGNAIFDAYLYTLTAGQMGDRRAVE